MTLQFELSSLFLILVPGDQELSTLAKLLRPVSRALAACYTATSLKSSRQLFDSNDSSRVYPNPR